ncbi:AraC family transcriptional regulator, partial [Ancylomarina sp. 16SWW S1-10-2]|nr:AraC family transcriptional regulator [Ancylomarina sp. 16SWW S1-10-2]
MTASEHANAQKDSISITLVHEALFEAEKQGYAVADILKNAGINSELLSATKA